MNSIIDLLTLLDEDDEPFQKRLKIADTAFKSCDLPLQHKEAALMNWLANRTTENNADIWKCFSDWVSTRNFKDLTRNDIDNEGIINILKIVGGERIDPTDITTETLIVNSILELINCTSFQHYFKFNCEVYCNFLTRVISKIRSLTNLKHFLKKIPVTFISSENGFVEAFLNNSIDGLVDCVKVFEDEDVFDLASSIIQKCFFYNCQSFRAFVDQFLLESKINEQNIPNTLLKYLIYGYEKHDIETVRIVYKLIFHAFCKAYDYDCDLIFKFLIVLTHVIGFNSGIIIAHKNSKLHLDQCRLSLRKSETIFFELLNIYHINVNPNFEVNKTNLKLFLENILREILGMKNLSQVSYRIIEKCIDIEPLIINHLIDEILINTMVHGSFYKTALDESRHTANSLDNSIITKSLIHTNIEESDHIGVSFYEQEYHLITTIFDIYSKLNGIEGTLKKIVAQFYNWCTEKNVTPNVTEDCKFQGTIDRDCIQENGNARDLLTVNNTFTKAISKKFSQSIETLASWQVINIFKTLFHAMKEVVELIETYEYGDLKFYMYVGLLSELLCTFMSSIRVAEHTVSPHTMEKTVNALKKLQDLMKDFAKRLLSREHDPQLMRSFLNIAYQWGEIRIVLAHYSSFEYCQLNPPTVIDSRACNVTFIHSYLDVREWCLMSERITNFGETPCKTLLHKLYVQKLRAMYLLEDNVTHDAIHDIISSISMHIGDNWVYILSTKFIINNLLPEMNNQTIIGLSQIFVHEFRGRLVCSAEERDLNKLSAVQLLDSSSSQLLLNAVSYVCISKINKTLLKYKNTQDDNSTNTFMSSKMRAVFDEDIFLSREYRISTDTRVKEILNVLIQIFTESIDENVKRPDQGCAIRSNENRLFNLLEVFKHFPTIHCNSQLHEIYFVYFIALHHDFQKNIPMRDKKLSESVEKIVIGILQHYKFSSTNTAQSNIFLFEILNSFDNWKETFTIAAENIFKNETTIKCTGDFISKLCDNLLDPKHMSCAAIILHFVNKLKKKKMPADTKIIATRYKQEICSTILKLIKKNKCITEPLLIGYAHVLKHVASLENNNMINILEKYLQKYLDYALSMSDPQKLMNKDKQDQHNQLMSHIILFTTLLQNISKFSSIVSKKDIILKIWDASKDMVSFSSEFEEYGMLLGLIFIHIPNDQFILVTTYLMDASDRYIKEKNHAALSKQLFIWEYLICDLNAVKTNILMEACEYFVLKITRLFSGMDYNEELFTSIYNFEKRLIQASHLHLTLPLINLLLLHPVCFMNNGVEDFQKSCSRALSFMSFLLKFRKPLIMDRLPVYLRQYRLVLSAIYEHGNTDLCLQEVEIRQISDCAHLLEKLTKCLVSCQKDINRISIYLLGDILHQFERTTFYTEVKMHLNNCIYSLISACDQHAVAYLMRALSNASTEMFKMMYDSYKKYYRFTGKV